MITKTYFWQVLVLAIVLAMPAAGQEELSGFPNRASRLVEPPNRIEIETCGEDAIDAAEKQVQAALMTIRLQELIEISRSSEEYFPPIGNLGRWGARWPAPKVSQQTNTIVQLGPAAIPELMAALADQSKTEIVLFAEHLDAEFTFEVCNKCFVANGAIPGEMDFFAKRLWLEAPDVISTSTVTQYSVGKSDLAMLLLGQITNRPYRIIHWNELRSPTLVVSGMTEDASLASALRDYWSTENPRQRLFDSLVLDFCTRPIPEEKIYLASNCAHVWIQVEPTTVQINALARLLHYFPDESEEIIVARINGILDSSDDQDLDSANGICVIDFLHECKRSNSTKIREALAILLQRTLDGDIHRVLSEKSK